MRRPIAAISLAFAFLFVATGLALEAHLLIAHSDCCGHEHAAPEQHDDCQICCILFANVKTTADLPEDAPDLVETHERIVCAILDDKPLGCTFGEPSPRGPPFA